MAKTTNKPLPFEASAFLQTLIGRELFRSQEFAIVELVKNAYDSGAHSVEVTISPPSDTAPDEIVIRDDGDGMTLQKFSRVFMFAGYSDRPGEVATAPRVPTGEKGIGRFAADRLGSHLSVTTKARNRAALRVDIDWNQFKNRRKKFSDIAVPHHKGDLGELRGAPSGTVLRITKLREDWNRKQLLALRFTLAELLDPYHPPRHFTIGLTVRGSAALSGPIDTPKLPAPDLDVSFRVLKNGTVSRTLSGGALHRPITEKVSSSADTIRLAGLRGRFLYYLKRPSAKLTQGLRPRVRLYRDGFRIEPFGTETSDWLGISERRAKRAGHAHIVPSRLFGFVAVSRRKHKDLRDTTSREALLDTEATRSLVTALREQVEFLENRIREHVSEPRWEDSRKQKAEQLERERLHTLSILSSGLAHELRQPLQTIRSEAHNIVVRLGQLDIHDADITESQERIDEEIGRINKNIQLITEIANPDLDAVEQFDLATIIAEIGGYFDSRCKAQGITLEMALPSKHTATLTKAVVSMVLINLVRNAVDALLEVTDDRSRRVKISLNKARRMHKFQVADNGNGIDPEVQGKIFKKFASRKTGGMGVGLYHCSVIVKAHGGRLTFDSRKGVGTRFTVELPEQAQG